MDAIYVLAGLCIALGALTVLFICLWWKAEEENHKRGAEVNMWVQRAWKAEQNIIAGPPATAPISTADWHAALAAAVIDEALEYDHYFNNIPATILQQLAAGAANKFIAGLTNQ